VLMCCRACQTCCELRLNMKDNTVLHRQDALTKAKKRKEFKRAEKTLMKHLNDFSEENESHVLYDVDKLFPTGLYVWGIDGYAVTETVVMDERETTFLEVLHDQRTDMTEGHYVAVSKKLQRDGTGEYARPKNIEVGHIVIFMVQDLAEDELPWCVGEVMSHDGDILSVCQYGSEGRRAAQKTENIQWGARFKGSEYRVDPKSRKVKKGKRVKVWQEGDEYHMDASIKPSTAAMKLVLLDMSKSAIAEYDVPERMLLKGRTRKGQKKAPSGRGLQQWVFAVLSGMVNVNWVHDKSNSV
jgi:hypothetical protein